MRGWGTQSQTGSQTRFFRFSRLVTRRTFTTWDCFGVATFEDCIVHSEQSEDLHCEYLRFVSSVFFFFFFNFRQYVQVFVSYVFKPGAKKRTRIQLLMPKLLSWSAVSVHKLKVVLFQNVSLLIFLF